MILLLTDHVSQSSETYGACMNAIRWAEERSEEAYVADGARNWNIGKDHWARFSFPGHTRLAGIKRPVDKGARRISAPTHSR